MSIFIKRFSTRQEISTAVILICLFFLLLIFWFWKMPTIVLTNLVGLFVMIMLICIGIFISEFFRKIDLKQNLENDKYESNYEKKFANYLKRKNVRYNLHPKLKVKGKTGKIICTPDFYLPEFEVYVEIWGKIDDNKYKEDSKLKKETYKNNQIEYVDLYPKNFENLDWDFTMKIFEIFKERQGIQRHWR